MSSVDELIDAAHKLLKELEKEDAELPKYYVTELPIVDEAKKILRKTSPENAFHFHLKAGRPLWISSDNLIDLYMKIKEINLEAVEYHFQRGDFEM